MTKPNTNTNNAAKPVTPNAVTIAAYNATSAALKGTLDSQGKAYNPAKVATWGLAQNQDSGEIFPGRALRGMVEGFRKDAGLAAAASAFLDAVTTAEAFDAMGDGRPYFRALATALVAASKLGPLLDAAAAAKLAAEKAAKVREALKAAGKSDAEIAELLGE